MAGEAGEGKGLHDWHQWPFQFSILQCGLTRMCFRCCLMQQLWEYPSPAQLCWESLTHGDCLSMIHFPFLYYVCQLYESMEYTDLVLKGHTVSREERHETDATAVWHRLGVYNRGMLAGLQTHRVLTCCQEAGTACLAWPLFKGKFWYQEAIQKMCRWKNVQPKSLIRVYLNQTDDCCLEAKSQQIKKLLQRTAVLQFVLYMRIKRRCKEGCMKSICGQWSEREKAKWGNLW